LFSLFLCHDLASSSVSPGVTFLSPTSCVMFSGTQLASPRITFPHKVIWPATFYTREILLRLASQALPIADAFLAPRGMESRGGPLMAVSPETSNRRRVGHRRRMPLLPLGLLASSSLPEMTDVPNASNVIRFISYGAATRTKWRNQCIA
jgi:hypothetical protein